MAILSRPEPDICLIFSRRGTRVSRQRLTQTASAHAPWARTGNSLVAHQSNRTGLRAFRLLTRPLGKNSTAAGILPTQHHESNVAAMAL